MGQQGFWDVEARQAKLAAKQSTLEVRLFRKQLRDANLIET
jgi:hypothetical protein